MLKHHLKNLLRPQMKTNILDKIRDYKINEVKERKINFPQNDIIDLINNVLRNKRAERLTFKYFF